MALTSRDDQRLLILQNKTCQRFIYRKRTWYHLLQGCGCCAALNLRHPIGWGVSSNRSVNTPLQTDLGMPCNKGKPLKTKLPRMR
jgi:hypothetical protein